MTVIVCWTWAAAAHVPLPGWLASTMHVPIPEKVMVEPFVPVEVQAPAVLKASMEKATVKLELAVAATV